jgi:hypothetical protein
MLSVSMPLLRPEKLIPLRLLLVLIGRAPRLALRASLSRVGESDNAHYRRAAP